MTPSARKNNTPLQYDFLHFTLHRQLRCGALRRTCQEYSCTWQFAILLHVAHKIGQRAQTEDRDGSYTPCTNEVVEGPIGAVTTAVITPTQCRQMDAFRYFEQLADMRCVQGTKIKDNGGVAILFHAHRLISTHCGCWDR